MGLNTNSGSPLLGGGSSSTTSTTGSSVTSACGAGGGVGSSGSGIVCGGGESEDGDEDIWDLKQQFHNTVRENIIFMLFFLILCVISWFVIGVFIRKKDKDEKDSVVPPRTSPPTPADDDESVVFRICLWLCVFSLSISMGATLLLPLSIISNEVLLLYPKTYHVQWLNGMLIQGLWNLIFLFANISLFILLPFAHLFIESEGFSGHKKGLMGKFYETVVVLFLSGFAIWGISHILAAVLSPGRSVLGGLFNLIGFSNQLPFIYSCISFFGVLLLLLCTPLGVTHLFTVLSQLLVGPQFLRNLEEEHREKFLQVQSMQSKLKERIRNSEKMKNYLSPYANERKENQINSAWKKKIVNNKQNIKNDSEPIINIEAMKLRWEAQQSSMDSRDEIDAGDVVNRDPKFIRQYHRMMSIVPHNDELEDDEALVRAKIESMEKELIELDKLKMTPGWKRNLLYPLAFLIVLVLTALTIIMVSINTLQLIVGLKSLPLSAQSFSLGITSMSILGAWGAGLEIILILYLMTTSLVGLYNLPGINKIKPHLGDSPTSHIIYNCALVLVLSSALPLLSRILGITNFDLLGNFGQIEWLGNFYIVFSYNVIFSVASALSLLNKFTLTIRQELWRRIGSVFRFRWIGSRKTAVSFLGQTSSPFSSNKSSFIGNGDFSHTSTSPISLEARFTKECADSGIEGSRTGSIKQD